MKKLLALLLLFGIVGCSPSKEDIVAIEKQNLNVSISSCNLMRESSADDGVLRLREVNAAREKMGKKLFLGTDADIKVSIYYGLCSLLVLDDPLYDIKLQERIDSEKAQRLLAEQERLKKEEENRKQSKELEDSVFAVFVLRVHLLSSEDNANKMVAQINEGGFPAFFEIDSDTKRYAVFVGPFIEETDITDNIDLIQKAAESNSAEISRWEL